MEEHIIQIEQIKKAMKGTIGCRYQIEKTMSCLQSRINYSVGLVFMSSVRIKNLGWLVSLGK